MYVEVFHSVKTAVASSALRTKKIPKKRQGGFHKDRKSCSAKNVCNWWTKIST